MNWETIVQALVIELGFITAFSIISFWIIMFWKFIRGK